MATASNQRTSEDNHAATLAGACELGILEETWEHYFARPAYNYLFVIDAPAISAVHALPPHNIPQFSVTSFLDGPKNPKRIGGMTFEERQRHFREQSRAYPLTLAVTEILARYVFSSRWSGGEPKFIVSHQIEQLSTIVDRVEQRSTQELRHAIRSAGDADSLQQLRRRLEGVLSADSLLETISERLEELLPEIYGTYTGSRQLFRYFDVLPFDNKPECPSAFLDSIPKIRQILEESRHQQGDQAPTAVVGKWSDAIPPAPPLHHLLVERYGPRAPRSEDSRVHEAQARTLAEVEVINRALEQKGDRHRLVFVTPTGRLFRAALRRFDCMPRQYDGGPKVRFGSDDSFFKLYYHATSLTTDAQALEPVPLMDPRVLMASPDFVQFASRREVAITDYTSRSISAWIPLFFSSLRKSSGGLDVDRLWQRYEHLQRDKGRRADSAAPDATFHDLKEFDTDALRDSWESYIRIVAAAESSDRVIQREMFAKLRAALKNADSQNALQAAVARQLDSKMSRWLSYVGSKAIRGILARHRTHAEQPAPRFAVAPPLIMPSLSAGTVAIDDLAVAAQSGEVDGITLEWLTDPQFVHPNIAPDDTHRELKTRYLQILGQSALFASLEDWESAHTLADQAYSLADSVLAQQLPESPTYVSGREAAFFASATKRRLPSSRASIDQLVGEGEEWVARLRAAIEREVDLTREASFRYQVHQIRVDAEVHAWQGLRWLYRSWEAEMYTSGSQLAEGLGTLKLDHLVENYESLVTRVEAELHKIGSYEFRDEKTRLSYSYALSAMLIDTVVDALEIELVAASTRGADNERLARLLGALERTALDPRLRAGTSRRTHTREQLVLSAATAVTTGSADKALDTLSDAIDSLDGLDHWRANMILRCVGR
jgi:hypothetical protein